MFPVLVAMSVRLARREENETKAAFGEAFDRGAGSGIHPALDARIKKGAPGSA